MLKRRVFIDRFGEIFTPALYDTVSKITHKHTSVSYHNYNDALSYAENSINTQFNLKRYKEIKVI